MRTKITIIAIAVLPLSLCMATSAGAQAANSCGNLVDVLRFGADETQANSTRDEARRLYRFACDEQSRSSQRNTSTSIGASYSLFSASARNNSGSIDEYREQHCSLSEDDVASLLTENFRQRSVNPAVVAAWSACISSQTGILLDPRLDPNQKVASFSITYDVRRVPTVPTLRGVSSRTFACETAGEGEPIVVGGDPIEISPTEALVIRCDRNSETGHIDGRPVTVYREDSLILDLSTGGHRIDFAARREGPAVDEFSELQAAVRSLETQLEAERQFVTDALKQVQGTIPQFGGWVGNNRVNTNYRAETDGFVVLFSRGGIADILTGPESNPTTIRTRLAKGGGVVLPVPKGHSWRVRWPSNGGRIRFQWMPVAPTNP